MGVTDFDVPAANAVGQKPFHLDLRCLAQVPLTERWFPDLGQPGHGIVGTAGARLRDRIDDLLRVRFESHPQRALRRSRSMTEAA